MASYVKASNDDDNLRNPYGDTFGSAVNVASETMSMIPSGETKEERAVAASDELPTAFKQALTKEDEDFARMEAAFVELLGIGPKGDISNASTHVVTK